MSISSALDQAQSEATSKKHVLRCMDPQEGDVKIIWDPDNKDEVAHARDTFDKFSKKGLVGYSVKKDGEKAEVVKKFDPDMEALIMAPPLAGG